MSDTHDHDHEHHDHGGGHEIDRMPNSRLFNLLFGLSALTLLAGVGVVQLFNMQVRALEDHRGAEPGFRIALHQKDLNLALTAARQLGLALPATGTAQQLFSACVSHGGAAWDHSGMVRALEKLSNFEIRQKA